MYVVTLYYRFFLCFINFSPVPPRSFGENVIKKFVPILCKKVLFFFLGVRDCAMSLTSCLSAVNC